MPRAFRPGSPDATYPRRPGPAPSSPEGRRLVAARDEVVLRLLASGPKTRNQIADALNVRGFTAYASLKRLRAAGRVTAELLPRRWERMNEYLWRPKEDA